MTTQEIETKLTAYLDMRCWGDVGDRDWYAYRAGILFAIATDPLTRDAVSEYIDQATYAYLA